MGKIWRTLFEYTGEIRFETKLPVAKAVDVLSHKCAKRNPMMMLGSLVEHSTLDGWVGKDRVVLHRIRPMIGNYQYKPIFYGRFIERGGGAGSKASL